jgi:peptidoglycan/xylan/chitin deacetylase (PgdA/CDA1 family)
MLNIVMYHYVRPIANSMFPRLKGLELELFRNQLDYFQNNYEILTTDQVISFLVNKIELPKDSVWLTFDDGYKDHIQYVLPELLSRNLQAAFFPPAEAVIERKILDVNAIHFILASIANDDDVFRSFVDECYKCSLTDQYINAKWLEMNKESRYDSEKIIFVKRMLQKELPLEIRKKIITDLFVKHTGRTDIDFADELYMSITEVKELVDCGMYVGSHAYSHSWLDSLSLYNQELEIRNSLDFLHIVGAPTNNWIMCYPYGAYNAFTIELLKNKGCILGLTTKVGQVNINNSNLFELNRFDTNDFPTSILARSK